MEEDDIESSLSGSSKYNDSQQHHRRAPPPPPPQAVPYPKAPVNSGAPASQLSSSSANNERDDEPTTATDSFGFYRPLSASGSLPVHTSAADGSRLRSREKKWVVMLKNWRDYMENKFPTVKRRCRKGIPPSIRGTAWKYLSGAVFQMEQGQNKHVFEMCRTEPGEPRWVEAISKDLHRQFPNHEMFARQGRFSTTAMCDLFELLKAWTVLHPEEGYSQLQAPLAAVLLMQMPVKDAFYCFVQLGHKYLSDYFSAGLEGVQMDGDILMELLKRKASPCYRHLRRHEVDPILWMTDWFMCLFCRSLPWSTVLRVWDMFFCEGIKVIFKVAIVYVKIALGTDELRREYDDLHAIVMRLKNVPPEELDAPVFIPKVLEQVVQDGELEAIHFQTFRRRQLQFSKQP